MCTSLRIRIRERLEKYFLLSVRRRKLCRPGPRFFIIWNIPICNSGQYIYVTGLCNFFFVPQDLIDRINSYFQRIDFQRNLLLFGFYHSTSQFFLMKIVNPQLNDSAYTCKQKLWRKAAGEYQMLKSPVS